MAREKQQPEKNKSEKRSGVNIAAGKENAENGTKSKKMAPKSRRGPSSSQTSSQTSSQISSQEQNASAKKSKSKKVEQEEEDEVVNEEEVEVEEEEEVEKPKKKAFGPKSKVNKANKDNKAKGKKRAAEAEAEAEVEEEEEEGEKEETPSKKKSKRSKGDAEEEPKKAKKEKKVTTTKENKDTKPKKKYRPGVQVLREIRKLQGATNTIIPKTRFIALVRQLASGVQLEGHPIRFTAKSLEALQEATESYLVGLFEDTNLCALHARRVTVSNRDLTLAIRIRGDRFRR